MPVNTKEYIFGMLFLNLEARQRPFRSTPGGAAQAVQDPGHGRGRHRDRAQRPEHYSGKYFYAPPRARWNQAWQETVMEDGVKKTVQRPALKHTKENVGTTLNKALEAIDEQTM